MLVSDLAKRLAEMYADGTYDKTVGVHLFGIRYAKQIKDCGSSLSEIFKMAVQKNGEPLPHGQLSELRKGVTLAEYVVEKKLCGRTKSGGAK